MKESKEKYFALNNIIQKNNQTIDFLKLNAPHIFDDNEINIEKLKQHLGLENNLEQNEKYGLNWVGKSKAFFETTKTSTMTLIPWRNKSMNFDESDNIIIEGDNLEVLKLLEKSYFNKIDVIYIDPPYNTGNDFVYNDEFQQSKKEFDIENDLIDEDGNKQQTRNARSDGKFHTNWLNMMYPRLILARKLLKDDGVIFISIDDNEHARLKMVCDEIFGEQNFVACFVRKTVSHIRKLAHNEIQTLNDFILVYFKNKISSKINKKKKGIKTFQYVDANGKFELKNFQNSGEDGKRSSRPNLYYPIFYNKKVKTFSLQKKDEFDIEILPKKVKNEDGRWLWKKETFLNNLDKFVYQNNTLYYKKYECEYESLDIFENFKNWLDNFLNKDGSNLLSKLSIPFNYPKPLNLIKFLIDLYPNKNALVLDFFAGSGTTGQAVMELNKEDGGNRKYILVQLNEKIDNSEFQYISDITRERIKRSIEMNDYKEKGFKYFKLVDSNLKSFDSNTNDSVETIQSKLFDIENKIKDGTSVEDLIYEIILRIGKLPLDTKIVSQIIENNNVYYDESKTCLFLLEPSSNSKHYENIIKVVKNIFIKEQHLIVFLNDQLFKNDQDKINFAEEVNNLSKDNIELVVI